MSNSDNVYYNNININNLVNIDFFNLILINSIL